MSIFSLVYQKLNLIYFGKLIILKYCLRFWRTQKYGIDGNKVIDLSMFFSEFDLEQNTFFGK